jgi:hypothetical protein
MALADTPFAALTVIAAPAILTNASSVLALGTGNRIARVVDRTRFLMRELSTEPLEDLRREVYQSQLDGLQVRAQLLLRALRWFYTSLGAFAASALIAVVGSVVAAFQGSHLSEVFAIGGLAVGTLGVTGLVTGCTLMVQETRLAVRYLTVEARLVKAVRNG